MTIRPGATIFNAVGWLVITLCLNATYNPTWTADDVWSSSLFPGSWLKHDDVKEALQSESQQRKSNLHPTPRRARSTPSADPQGSAIAKPPRDVFETVTLVRSLAGKAATFDWCGLFALLPLLLLNSILQVTGGQPLRTQPTEFVKGCREPVRESSATAKRRRTLEYERSHARGKLEQGHTKRHSAAVVSRTLPRLR